MLSTPPSPLQVRETSWKVLLLLVIATKAAVLLFLWMLSHDSVYRAIGDIQRATGHLVQQTLLFNLVSLAILVACVFGFGRLRCSDVGWRASAIIPGVLITLGFWIAMQAVLILITTLRDGEVVWDGEWQQRGARYVIGGLIAQVFGNALAEETYCRGVLLPQFYIKASRRWRKDVAMVVVLLGLGVLFSLAHIPIRLYHGVSGAELGESLLRLFVASLIYTALFLATRNLFVAVGLHALWNRPSTLVQAPTGLTNSIWWVLAALVITFCLFARHGRRRIGNRETPSNSSSSQQ